MYWLIYTFGYGKECDQFSTKEERQKFIAEREDIKIIAKAREEQNE